MISDIVNNADESQQELLSIRSSRSSSIAAMSGETSYEEQFVDRMYLRRLLKGSEEPLRGELQSAYLTLMVAYAPRSSAALVDVLERMVRLIYQIVPVERATLFAMDKSENELVLVINKKMTERGLRIPVASAGLAGACVQSGEPINIPDAYEDSRFAGQEHDRKTGIRSRQLLAIPLKRVEPTQGRDYLASLLSADDKHASAEIESKYATSEQEGSSSLFSSSSETVGVLELINKLGQVDPFT